mmetsp:Transcript_3541/g.6507  ORF Transcript_3541/g.6507 Transcript_3541/m.6507 type:complete len:111 (-) Transcript_3541:131-463(-)
MPSFIKKLWRTLNENSMNALENTCSPKRMPTANSNGYISRRSSIFWLGVLISSDEASLMGFVAQRQQMRGIKRKVSDIGHKLRISKSTNLPCELLLNEEILRMPILSLVE